MEGSESVSAEANHRAIQVPCSYLVATFQLPLLPDLHLDTLLASPWYPPAGLSSICSLHSTPSRLSLWARSSCWLTAWYRHHQALAATTLQTRASLRSQIASRLSTGDLSFPSKLVTKLGYLFKREVGSISLRNDDKIRQSSDNIDVLFLEVLIADSRFLSGAFAKPPRGFRVHLLRVWGNGVGARDADANRAANTIS